MAQYDRDAVIEILYPDQLTIVDTDYVEIDFYLAPFFAIGDSGCTDCDGYIKAYLNDEFYGNVFVTGPYAMDGLLDGDNFLELVVVDTGGQNFTPVLHDTVTFGADYTDDYCPPANLIVSSDYEYEVLTVFWTPPFGSGGAEGVLDFELWDGGFVPTADWDPVGDWEWTAEYDATQYIPTTHPPPPAAHSGTGLWATKIYDLYTNAGGISFLRKTVNLAGYTEVELSFYSWFDVFGDFDHTEIYANGVEVWSRDLSTISTDWEYIVVDLTDFAGDSEVELSFEFYATTVVNYAGWYLDDVYIGAPQPVQVTEREDIEGCGDFVRFDLYRDGALFTAVDTNFYRDAAVVLGQEYCYFVTAVYDTNGVEISSVPTDTVCGTPGVFEPPPPTYLRAIEGDEEVALFWAPPGTVIPEGENCLNPYIIADNIADGTHLVLNGTTTGFANDFMNGFSAGSPDVVYQLNVIETVDIAFSLCGGATWDTYLMLLSGDCMEILAYDDDGCATGLQSLIEGTIDPGVYKIVVDGFGTTNSGDYALEITATASTRSTGFNASIVDYEKPVDPELLAAFNREIANSNVVANSEYLPNTTMDLEFGVNYSSSDVEYLDGMSLTFPADFVVNYATDAGGLVYNGETGAGATVTFGDFADDGYGELSSDAVFFVNVTIGDISGTQTLNWGLSGDTWGSDPHDVSGTLDIEENIPADGDFLGYNIYVDDVQDNTTVINSLSYLAQGLTNGQTYDFDVVAVYFPDWVSAPTSISATPTWLFGDLTGVVTDPIGNLLDSAVVSVGGLTDTTGADGVYLIYGIVPGSQTVTVSRSGFDGSSADVTIIAQEAAVTQDFSLIPKLGKPGGLIAAGGDHIIHLEWNSPGAGEEITLQYDDGIIENAFYFYRTYEDGFAHGIRFDVGGDFDVLAASLRILSEGDPFWPWPDATHGPVRVLVFDDNNGQPGNLIHDEEVVAQDGWATVYPDITGLFGSFYVIATHYDDWQTTGDPEGFCVDGSVDFADNNYTYDTGVWYVGDGGYGGDYMMAALVSSYGRVRALSHSDLPPEYSHSINDNAVAVHDGSLTAGNAVVTHPIFSDDYSRDNALIGYNAYQVMTDGDSLVATNAVDDTTAAISVPDNYVEYCFTVKAIWETDLYDTLESKPSSIACAETFKPGDVDFSDVVDITDLMVLVDFVLGITDPSDDQFRGGDINRDGMINIQDIILVVDLIFGTPVARLTGDGGTDAATLSITASPDKALNLTLDCTGPVRGLQFTLSKTAADIVLGKPVVTGNNGELLLASNTNANGAVTYVIARLDGQALDLSGEALLSIPYTVNGQPNKAVEIGLNNSKLAGMHGELIPVVERSTVIDFAVMPSRYALHQNYPNPFNPVTDIKFDLPNAGSVQLVIYNITGQKIRTLVSESLEAGFHQIRWNGMNDRNETVATGMYFYQLTAGKYTATKKMVILK